MNERESRRPKLHDRRSDPDGGDVGADKRRHAESATGGSETAPARPRDKRRHRNHQQANPGNVEPGFGDEQREPNPGNRKATGEREQVDLPEADDDKRRKRDVDRGTH